MARATTEAKIQTGLRLTPQLYRLVKMKADGEKRSVSNYLERLVESSVGPAFPTIPDDYMVRDDIQAMGIGPISYTKEELKDERLAALVEKHMK